MNGKKRAASLNQEVKLFCVGFVFGQDDFGCVGQWEGSPGFIDLLNMLGEDVYFFMSKLLSSVNVEEGRFAIFLEILPFTLVEAGKEVFERV